MVFRIAALLLLSVGSGALEVDIHQISSLTSDLHNLLSSSLRSLIHEHANPKKAPFPTLQNKTTCGECVRGGSKYVIDHTVAKMKDMCSNASKSDHSCVVKKVCDLMAKHSDVALGMMIEHVKPMSLAIAYCVGKGECEKPDQMTMAEITMGEEPHEALLENFDKMDFTDVEEQTMELVEEGNQEGQDLADAPECPQHMHHKVSPKCMKKTMRRVMGFAIMKVKAECADAQNSKNPVMMKMCPWMAEHKMVALGMLVAKVEPWKFAFGRCFHGHHGHRDHHDHHGQHNHHGPQMWHRGQSAQPRWAMQQRAEEVPIAV